MQLLNKYLATLFIAVVSTASIAENNQWDSLKSKKQTKLGLYMTPQQAYDYISNYPDNALFLDIRSRPEVAFVGMATNTDANVPYMKVNEWYAWNEKKNNFKMEVNSEFSYEVEQRLLQKGLDKNAPVILMCRSGSRSAKAANVLADLGFTQVYSIPEGFEGDKAKSGDNMGQRVVNGWKNAGLPWSYKLAKGKMYNPGVE